MEESVTESQAVLERMNKAATTRTIRIRLNVGDVARLREIAQAQRRPAQEQAAWMLERAIRSFDAGPSEEPQG